MTLTWRPEDLNSKVVNAQLSPSLQKSDWADICDKHWFWDFAPVVDSTGTVFVLNGKEYWLALTAPTNVDAPDRHFVAKLGLLTKGSGGWKYHGKIISDDLHPGNRQWAGMACVEEDVIRVYFTSAGRGGETRGYQQRLFEISAGISLDDEKFEVGEWAPAVELLEADDGPYFCADQSTGEPGFIRAFRDPFRFVDNDGMSLLLFTASSANSGSRFNGAIGCAMQLAAEDRWIHRGAVVESHGVTTELERPHVVCYDGLYYLFWSTQRYTFSAECAVNSTGLYGAVSKRADGEYRLLNGSGLVVANPEDRPYQVYSWFVTPQLRVQGFVDLPHLKGSEVDGLKPPAARDFVGTAAPQFSLKLRGDRAEAVAAGR